MAKTPKLKGNSKRESVQLGKKIMLFSDTCVASAHSRAARRAASPSVDVEKSLTSLPRPDTPQIPAAHVSSGITKKKSKSKPKSRAQRLRQEKGLERAEIIMDQLEKKVNKSIEKSKVINRRRVNYSCPIMTTFCCGLIKGWVANVSNSRRIGMS